MLGNKNTRLDEQLNEFEKGRIFGLPSGEMIDLSKVLFCNVAVDTVRQLYKGTINRFLLQDLQYFADTNENILLEKDFKPGNKELRFRNIRIPCDMQLKKMGKMSGYQYKLQNNETGLVILFKSFHADFTKEASHLKIELSPHFISQRTPQQVQTYLNKIAKMFLHNPKPAGVAVHQCVDFQGWNIPNDLAENIVTRSRAIKSYKGRDTAALDNFDLISTYNRNETITIGSANALQLSVYRKDLEVIKHDKVDYFRDIWGEYTLGEYNPNEPVIRVETRAHHNIVKQFSESVKEELVTFEAVSKYLGNLWQYALNSVKYTHQTKKNIHPLWQLLDEDISWEDGFQRCEFKRTYAAKKDTGSITRNIAAMVGNLLSIHARTNREWKDILNDIKNSPALIEPLRQFFLDQQIQEGVYFAALEKRLIERRIASKYGIAS